LYDVLLRKLDSPDSGNFLDAPVAPIGSSTIRAPPAPECAQGQTSRPGAQLTPQIHADERRIREKTRESQRHTPYHDHQADEHCYANEAEIQFLILLVFQSTVARTGATSIFEISGPPEHTRHGA
jgi:hypothetical protein